MADVVGGLAVAVLQGLKAAALEPRLLRTLLIAGAPLRLAVAANVWAGRSIRCAAGARHSGVAGTEQRARLPASCCRDRLTTPPPMLSCGRRRSLAAEIVRRLLELSGWLFGRVDARRLRAFERAYFRVRRWHVALGETASQPAARAPALPAVAVTPRSLRRSGLTVGWWWPIVCRSPPNPGMVLVPAAPCPSLCSHRRGGQGGAMGGAAVGGGGQRGPRAAQGLAAAHAGGRGVRGVGGGGTGGAPPLAATHPRGPPRGWHACGQPAVWLPLAAPNIPSVPAPRHACRLRASCSPRRRRAAQLEALRGMGAKSRRLLEERLYDRRLLQVGPP